MPTFIEFLLAPWKILNGWLGSGPPGTPAHTGLCYVHDVGGGQMINVCRIAGYEMPAFIFFACILILVLFIVMSRNLLKNCTKIAQTLERVSIPLSQLVSQEPGRLSSEDLAAIRHLIQKEELLTIPWRQFEETLLLSSNQHEIYSTCPVETILSHEALVEDHINTALYNALPGVLTGIGLLMTFVAILDGLSHVSVAANMDVQGIGGLINGLSGKFTSSIIAVTCAVSFIFIERVAYSRPHRAYRKLITALSFRFKRRTTEHLLQDIQSQLSQQAHYHEDLLRSLGKSSKASTKNAEFE